MATISRTGITGGGTIQPAHITNIIDALDGTSATTTVIATGSFTGSLIGALTGTASFATTATNATNVAVTNTTTGTGPYYVTFVEAATGNVGQRVDATGLTYNATTNTITATSSYAAAALSSSFATTASYVLNAVSSSFATTASYALQAQSASFATSASFASVVPASGVIGLNLSQIVTGSVTASVSPTQFSVTSGSSTELVVTGTGVVIGNALTDNHAITGSVQITGSLLVTADVTASLQGTASVAVSSSRAVTASFADLSRQVLVQRTAADADHFMVIVDSGNATPAAESLNTVTNIRVNPGTDTISAVTVTGSFNVTGSMSAVKFATVDLRILGDTTSSGQFAIPIQQTGGSPFAGSMYWNDATEILYIYSATNGRWTNVQLNP